MDNNTPKGGKGADMPDSTTTPAAEGTTTTPADGGATEPAFKAITSQEDLDRIIAGRLAREAKKYDGYDELKKKAAELDKLQESAKSDLQKAQERAEAAEARAKLLEQQQQRTQWVNEVSKETGVPAAALHGDTLEDIKAVAAELQPHFKKNATPYAPGQGSKPAEGDGGIDPIRAMLQR
jgi:hypothetical protein